MWRKIRRPYLIHELGLKQGEEAADVVAVAMK